MTPQSVRAAQFKTVRKGLDPDEVRGFLDQVAAELERAQNHSTAMEARARAAVHRLQEVTEATTAEPTGAERITEVVAEPTSEQSDAITKTLLLAQRAADTTVAEARDEAERLLAEAREEADRSIAASQDTADQLLEEARREARAAGEQERLDLESDVSSLMARRDFLESDVDHLEKFLDAQRERMRDVAGTLAEMADRVPGGLGEVHRPVLSAAADVESATTESDDTEDDTGEFEPEFVASARAEGEDDPSGGADDAPDTGNDPVDPEVAWADDAIDDVAEPAHDDSTPADGATRSEAEDADPDDADGDRDTSFTLRFDDAQ
jgi:DivIVA domain-containing protein